MKIGGHTKTFAILGHPVGHTLSPVMHNAAFEALEMDAVYVAFDVPPERLPEVLAGMRAMGFGGANITVPLKETACKLMTRLDESAQLLGAVNTVKFTPDGMIGYNTDGDGFLRAVEEAFGEPVAGKSVFVCGVGGAGRAVAVTCAGSGARSIMLADTDRVRARKVLMEIDTQFFTEVSMAEVSDDWERGARAADLVVQATPLGMKQDDAPPIGSAAFRRGQLVFDLVYLHPETPLMKSAKAVGARTANGLGMLLYQGVRAFEIWTGAKPPSEVMRKALEKAVYGK
ncbi:MAG: shikimate dehydrogenase [Verrucomicrobiota bacterium]